MNGGTVHSGSRWNPTKEQLQILEDMYRQGIRTPTADQIQQITTQLREYGHIEGKNVFYWFQNHKARQRQKQKQESLGYLSPYPPTPAHGFQSRYSLAPHGSGIYPHYTPVLPARTVLTSARDENITTRKRTMTEEEERFRTLQLFPLHPTGFGEGGGSSTSSSIETNDLLL